MSLNNKIKDFDPNGLGDLNGNIYGLPFNTDEAKLVIIPVPWEVTVSYQTGTAEAPEAILEASYQVDLYDPFGPDAWKLGIAMSEVNQHIKLKGADLRENAELYIEKLSQGFKLEHNHELQGILSEINQACTELNHWLKGESSALLNQKKVVAVLGGDHSTPLGLIQALADKNPSFGILHIERE